MELSEIETKINEAKTNKAKAEGVIENIQNEWKNTFGLDSKEAVEAEIFKLEMDITEDQKKYDDGMKELESLIQ